MILGNTQQTGEQGLNAARSIALMAGLPVESGGATVNRQNERLTRHSMSRWLSDERRAFLEELAAEVAAEAHGVLLEMLYSLTSPQWRQPPTARDGPCGASWRTWLAPVRRPLISACCGATTASPTPAVGIGGGSAHGPVPAQ